jgi:hypothetical protein
MKADGRLQTADGRKIRGFAKAALRLFVLDILFCCSCFLLLPPDAHAQFSQTEGKSPL